MGQGTSNTIHYVKNDTYPDYSKEGSKILGSCVSSSVWFSCFGADSYLAALFSNTSDQFIWSKASIWGWYFLVFITGGQEILVSIFDKLILFSLSYIILNIPLKPCKIIRHSRLNIVLDIQKLKCFEHWSLLHIHWVPVIFGCSALNLLSLIFSPTIMCNNDALHSV